MITLAEYSVREMLEEVFNRYKDTEGAFICAHTMQTNGEPGFYTTWAGCSVRCLGLATLVRSELEDTLVKSREAE